MSADQSDMFEADASMGGGTYAAEQQTREPRPKPDRNAKTGALVDVYRRTRKDAFRDVLRWRILGTLDEQLRRILGDEYEEAKAEAQELARAERNPEPASVAARGPQETGEQDGLPRESA